MFREGRGRLSSGQSDCPCRSFPRHEDFPPPPMLAAQGLARAPLLGRPAALPAQGLGSQPRLLKAWWRLARAAGEGLAPLPRRLHRPAAGACSEAAPRPALGLAVSAAPRWLEAPPRAGLALLRSLEALPPALEGLEGRGAAGAAGAAPVLRRSLHRPPRPARQQPAAPGPCGSHENSGLRGILPALEHRPHAMHMVTVACSGGVGVLRVTL